LLLETAVQLARTGTEHVISPAKAKGKVVTALQKPLADAIDRRIRTQSLPPAIGCLRHGRSWVLFLMADILNAQPAQTRPAEPRKEPLPPPPLEKPGPDTAREPSVTFAHAFDAAFQQLDRQKGSHNFVSLVELRGALPMDRQAFDAGLRTLRQAGRYSLSGAEGRHGVTAEEQEAGIYEDGSLLLYVSRKLL
jgi:hypothetical protein